MRYRKIYGMNGTTISTIFNVNGRAVRVEFSGGSPTGEERVLARFDTEDKAMQDAIENDPRFGTTIFTERIIEIVKKETVSKKGKKKEFRFISRFQDAANILATQYGVPIDSLTNKKQLNEAAEKADVSFPNLR